MQQECKELLQMLSASLQAGYSVERAFSDAERELRQSVTETACCLRNCGR